MSVLLDTHILVWWYTGSEDLPAAYRALIDNIEKEQGHLFVSAMSLWEIAKLVSVGKLRLQASLDQWFYELEHDSVIEVLPLSAGVILESTRLGAGFHRDPADQLIVATARCHNLRLLTVDRRICESGAVIVA